MTALADYLRRAETRERSYLDWVTSWEEWLSFALLATAVLAAVTSIARADWVDGMTNLLLISFIGLVLGFLLAKVQGNGWLLQLPMLGIGFVLLTWQILAVVPGDGYAERWDTYWARIGDWIDTAINGGISNDPLPFVTIVSVLTYLASYIASWSIFRWRNSWVALLPVGVILFTNISFLPDKFDFALVIFLFAAVLLTMRMMMTRRREQWEDEDVEYPELISLSALHDTAWVAAVLLVAAWLVPTANNIPVLDNTWDSTVGGGGDNNGFFARLFAGVRSKTPAEIRGYDEFYQFRGDIDLESRTLLRVEAPNTATLLRGATYEEYSALGWLEVDRRQSSTELEVDADAGVEELIAEVPSLTDAEGTHVFVTEIEANAPTNTVFTVGVPLGADVEAILEASRQPIYVFNVFDERFDNTLPDELVPISEELREAANLNPLPLTNAEIVERLPAGISIVAIERGESGEVVQILATEGAGQANDTIRLESPDDLPDDTPYVSVGSTNQPEPDALNAAGDDYPAYISDIYLQLPDDLPQRIGDLAQQIVSGELGGEPAESNFARAVAIQNYLRQAYPENTDIDRPPFGADGVDYFLFGAREGYFDYHASAMAVMLRTLGIPARFVTGYWLDPAQYDAEDETFRLREREQFSWVDAYFPGIGWVEFSPSPRGPGLYVSAAALPGAGQSFFPQALNPDDLSGLTDLAGEGLLGPEDFPAPDSGVETGAEDVAVKDSGGLPTPVLIGVVTVVGGVILVFAAGNAVWQWGVRGLSYPAQVWEKTNRLASWVGLGARPNETPREFTRKLSNELPQVEGIDEMGAAYARAQFGRKELTPDESQRVKKVWRDVRGALVARLLRIRPVREQ
jgi:transglutaminase-like putative cysteine protease